MIRVFYKDGMELEWEKNPASLDKGDDKQILWIDLQSPTAEEIKEVEDLYDMEFFTPQEAAEIESTSRYFEDKEIIEANNAFVVLRNQQYVTEQISFIIKNDVLFTLRNADLKAFAETVRKLKTFHNGRIDNAFQIWLLLLETRTDLDADFIESLTRVTNNVSRRLLKQRSTEEEILLRITELQENTILIRQSIVDKQRLASSLLKSNQIDDAEKERLRIIIKDINSLLQHTEFSFERLEYLQDTFLGLVNIEQNQIIKIFTVVTVAFMPPTLVAAIYGMNFDFMPELHWFLGYPFALVLMVCLSFGFLWYFKRKNWL